MAKLELNEIEQERLEGFLKKHKQKHQEYPQIYFECSETGIGLHIEVVCKDCKNDPMVNLEDERSDITDYDDW